MKHLTPVLALVALALPLASVAAEPTRIRVGAGAKVEPEFPGADSMRVGPDFEFSVARGDKPFALGAPDDSFSIGLFESGGFSAGPAAAIGPRRNDSEVGSPVGDVKRSFELGGFVQQMIGENFRVRAEARKGIGGHKGLVGYAGADYIARDADLYTFTIGPRVRFGDDNYMDVYYGIRPEVSIAAALPVYDPDGGIRSVGATSGFTYQLAGPFGLFGFARYDRLVGDAADSPIVRQFGSPNQFSAGLGLSYTFNLDI